jgi:hypothetical protein
LSTSYHYEPTSKQKKKEIKLQKHANINQRACSPEIPKSLTGKKENSGAFR